MATVEGFFAVVNEAEKRALARDEGRRERPARVPASACAAGAREGGEAALGNLPKSNSQIREVLDEKTGEIQRFRLDSKRREYVQVVDEAVAVNEARSGRLLLQKVSRNVLKGKKNPRDMDWRVVGCTHRRIASEVAVLRNRATARARFGGVRICGSVWTCPVCGAKISEHRRLEIHAATDTHVRAGGGIYMLTLTFAHKRSDDVGKLVRALKYALKLLRAHRTYKQCQRFIDYVGLIRALEVTFGDANGWHPHVHELWLTASKLSRVQVRLVQKEIFDAWRVACVSAGLGEPNRKQGVTFIQAESAQEYVTKFGREPKWGVGSELAKSHSKRGRLASMTPFDLLRLAGEGDVRAAKLFETFAVSFYGARQLFWSRGLKKLFGIDDVSDEEVAVLEEGEAELVTRLSADVWRAVLRQPYDARGLVLELAEGGGEEAVLRFVGSLVES